MTFTPYRPQVPRRQWSPSLLPVTLDEWCAYYGAVASWNLDESSGTNGDEYINNHDVTHYGPPYAVGVTGPTGALGKGVTYDDVIDPGTTGHSETSDGGAGSWADLVDGPFTLVGLVTNVATSASQKEIIHRGTNGYDFSIMDNKVRCAKGGVAEIARGNTTLSTGSNAHYLAAWAKNGSSNTLWLGPLGGSVVDDTGSVSNQTLASTSHEVWLGAWDNGAGGSLGFLGHVWHVAVFPSVLTTANLQNILDAAGGAGPTTSFVPFKRSDRTSPHLDTDPWRTRDWR
jgi:hypothetical protein